MFNHSNTGVKIEEKNPKPFEKTDLIISHPFVNGMDIMFITFPKIEVSVETILSPNPFMLNILPIRLNSNRNGVVKILIIDDQIFFNPSTTPILP